MQSDAMLALQTDTQLTDAVGFIGKTVDSDGIVLMLQDGESTITYDLGGNVKTIISGDKHLLKVNGIFDIEILRPVNFLGKNFKSMIK